MSIVAMILFGGATFTFGLFMGRFRMSRRAVAIVYEKHASMPADDRCCKSALRDAAWDIGKEFP